MPISKEILSSFRINPRYEDIVREAFRPARFLTQVDILVVVDTEIATTPGVGFGIGSVIELIRGTRVGCMRFRVDIAERSGGAPNVVSSPAPFDAKYTGFRFDMTDNGSSVIDRYEQIWCFGFKPDNIAGPDSNIDLPSSFPTSDSELAKLANWMKERKGGIFATGDHDYLGASMCHQIPRIGTMRRWTNADGVPPIDTPDRIDTLRPPSPEFEPSNPGGPLPMSNQNQQGDLEPQPIDWVPWRTVVLSPFVRRTRPHPVLCHPTLGPINVMPDHAHEGLCRDTGTVNLDDTYDFDGLGAQSEYPEAIDGGLRPEPTVIAYGSTLASPPYNFSIGPQPARLRFPMVSVYDGHRAGVGRVATDSTWHHWMDVNITDMKNAAGTDWDKISRYFINLAVWLSPPNYGTSCLFLHTFMSHFQNVGLQEYSRSLDAVTLGRSLRDHLSFTFGPCWITEIVHQLLEILDLRFQHDPIWELPDPCLTCPPWDLIENAVLGGLIQASFDEVEKVKAAAAEVRNLGAKIESPEKLMLGGVVPALSNFAKEWRKDMKRSEKMLKQLVE